SAITQPQPYEPLDTAGQRSETADTAHVCQIGPCLAGHVVAARVEVVIGSRVEACDRGGRRTRAGRRAARSGGGGRRSPGSAGGDGWPGRGGGDRGPGRGR